MMPDAGTVLLRIARATIARPLGVELAAPEDAAWLAEARATFVTLKKNGELRGCIGSLDAERPLLVDLKSNATAAAFRDPRFPPVTSSELDEIRIEVSLLSPLSPIDFESDDDAATRLRPFEDGVVLEYGRARATFLPQVWEDLSDPAQFLAELKRKAGLPPSFWAPDLRLFRYTVSKWSETEPALAPVTT
jgi:AmmeMemoRadiSam system protein A